MVDNTQGWIIKYNVLGVYIDWSPTSEQQKTDVCKKETVIILYVIKNIKNYTIQMDCLLDSQLAPYIRYRCVKIVQQRLSRRLKSMTIIVRHCYESSTGYYTFLHCFTQNADAVNAITIILIIKGFNKKNNSLFRVPLKLS